MSLGPDAAALVAVCVCIGGLASLVAIAAHYIRRGNPPVSPAEQARRLASERDDLIAQGVDPADLLIPIYPKNDDQPGRP